MIQRCTNKKQVSWKNYGARGITVCARWRKSFLSFLLDIGRKPSGRHTLDRKDGDGNYEPGNCKWSTRHQQALNRRPHRKNAPSKYSKFVTKDRGMFKAQVAVLGTGKQKYVGRFATEREAAAAGEQEMRRQAKCAK